MLRRAVAIVVVMLASSSLVRADYNPTAAQLEQVVAEAKKWTGTPYKLGGHDKKGIDCSHLVQAAYAKVFKGFPYKVAKDYGTGNLFHETKSPQIGDVIYFPPPPGAVHGHVGIITDPTHKKFIGAQS